MHLLASFCSLTFIASIYLKDLCCKTHPHIMLVTTPYGITYKRVKKGPHNVEAREAFDQLSPDLQQECLATDPDETKRRTLSVSIATLLLCIFVPHIMGVTGMVDKFCFLGFLPLDNCEMSAATYYSAMFRISRHVIGALILNSLLFLGEICYRLQQLY